MAEGIVHPVRVPSRLFSYTSLTIIIVDKSVTIVLDVCARGITLKANSSGGA